MRIFVDELPSCCEDCVCHNGVSGRCKLLHRTTFDTPPRDCPLQTLADHEKQVRKQVCSEIGGEIYTQMIVYGKELRYSDLNLILDKIEKGEKQ